MQDRDELLARAGLILRKMEELAEQVGTDQYLQEEWRELEEKWRILMEQLRRERSMCQPLSPSDSNMDVIAPNKLPSHRTQNGRN